MSFICRLAVCWQHHCKLGNMFASSMSLLSALGSSSATTGSCNAMCSCTLFWIAQHVADVRQNVKDDVHFHVHIDACCVVRGTVHEANEPNRLYAADLHAGRLLRNIHATPVQY